MTVFMEKPAMEMGYWEWLNNSGPALLNSVCWMGMGLVLITLYEQSDFRKGNQFAVHLIVIPVPVFFILAPDVMSWIIYVGIAFGTFLIMEGITWLTHKYIMHGFLWYLHEDHHQKGPGFFEKNDAFFCHLCHSQFPLHFIGHHLSCVLAGVDRCRRSLCMVAAYFLVHDIIIHQRFKLFTRSNNSYVRAIRWAHKMHHKTPGQVRWRIVRNVMVS
jgi:beta-carotene 3-hydroxylase